MIVRALKEGVAVLWENIGNKPTAFNPTAHKATHEPGGVDALNVDAAANSGSLRTLGTGATQAAPGNDTRLSDARAPTAHKTSHEPGGTDALTGLTDAAVAAANKDGTAGVASLRTLGTGPQQAVAGNDTRLSDTRTPTDGSVTVPKHTANQGPWIRVANAAGRTALGSVREGQLVYQADNDTYYQSNSPDGTDAATVNWTTIASGGVPAASDTVAGIVRLDSPAADPANPHVYPRSSPVWAPHIEGLDASVSGGTLTVSPGSAYIPSLRRIVDLASAITVSSGGLTADTLYHLYLYVDGAGAPQIEASTVAAVGLETSGLTNPSGFPLRGGARVKGPANTPEYSRRYVGAARLTTGGVWLNQRPAGNGIYRYLTTPTGFSGNATTATTVSMSAFVPAGAILLAAVNANGALLAYFGLPGQTGESVLDSSPPNFEEATLLLDEARSLTYRSSTASWSVFVNIRGYTLRR